MIEIIFSFFNISKTKDFGKLIVLADLILLSFSLAFGLAQVSTDHLDEIMDSYVKKVLALVIAFTAALILTQSWVETRFESELNDSLINFEVVFSDDKRSEGSKNKTKVSFWTLKDFLQLVLCLSFSVVPLFCDRVYGIWEVLFFSILILKTTSIRYALNVGRIREKIKKMRKEIESLVRFEDEVDSFTKNFRLIRENLKKDKIVEKKIKKLIKCQNLINSQVSACNERFGVSILGIIFSAFLSLTYCGYNFFIEIETERSINILLGRQNLKI